MDRLFFQRLLLFDELRRGQIQVELQFLQIVLFLDQQLFQRVEFLLSDGECVDVGRPLLEEMNEAVGERRWLMLVVRGEFDRKESDETLVDGVQFVHLFFVAKNLSF